MTNPVLRSGKNTDCECHPLLSPPCATTFPWSRCQICQPSAHEVLIGAEYLPAVDAVREAFSDIKQHQQHLLAAVRAAVDG
jgi:hypothetical protein